MSTIYILQKEVPSLGLLTKVGMTTRDGEDRAREYGGGGWQIVRQFTIRMQSTTELRDLEHRIHERLSEYRCTAATGFGLTEVFTCTTAEAIRVAADEIEADPAGDDRVERLRKRTRRGVVRKIMQQHQSALAKYHLGHRGFGFSLGFDDLGFDDRELRKIHTNPLRALDNCGEDDPTFRALLLRELEELNRKLEEAKQEVAVQEAAQVRAANATKRRTAENAKRKLIYEAGRALESAKQQLGMPPENARANLAVLNKQRLYWGVAVFAAPAVGILLGQLWSDAGWIAVLTIPFIVFWRHVDTQVTPLQKKLLKLEKAKTYHSELLSKSTS